MYWITEIYLNAFQSSFIKIDKIADFMKIIETTDIKMFKIQATEN